MVGYIGLRPGKDNLVRRYKDKGEYARDEAEVVIEA
jgi:hypothetical protein